MNKAELRKEARVPINRRATLIVGDTTFPCMVMDMSNTGLLLMCSRPLAVGQVLGFRCELFPDTFMECKIEIRYANDDGAGAMIVGIEEKGAQLFQLFLQEHFSTQLSRSS